MSNTLKQVLAAISIALLIVILYLVSLFLSVVIGYFIGYLLTILPFVSGWLTATLPISAAQIPAITAWMGVLVFFIRSISTGRSQTMED